MITKIIISGKDSVLGLDKSHFAYNLAKDYYEKAVYATRDIQPAKFDVTQKKHWELGFPIAIVSFSLELAMKLFLKDADIKELKGNNQGHTLPLVYSKISKESKVKIEAHYADCHTHDFGFVSLIIQKDNNVTPQKLPEKAGEFISAVLNRNKKPFVDFRYFYELNSETKYYFDFAVLIKLTHCCLAIRADQLGINDYKSL